MAERKTAYAARSYTSKQGSLPRSGLSIPMPAGAKAPGQGKAPLASAAKPKSSGKQAAE
jgi:hypothetical protein